MIVPVGNNKHQVNQGGFKHESIMNSSLFDGITKEAIGSLDVSPEKPELGNQPDVGRALEQGGLDPNRHDRGIERDRGNADLGLAGEHPDSIAPSGHPQTSGAPADQFMGTDPNAQQQDVANPYVEDVQKIKQFFGSSKWGLKITPTKDGSLELVITPTPGAPVDASGLLQKLQEIVGGTWGGESTPATEVGGPITFKYTPTGMGAEGATKVTKDGPPLGAPDQSGGAGPPGPPGQIMETV